MEKVHSATCKAKEWFLLSFFSLGKISEKRKKKSSFVCAEESRPLYGEKGGLYFHCMGRMEGYIFSNQEENKLLFTHVILLR